MAQASKRKRPRADEPLPDHISKSSKSSGAVHRPSNFPPEFYDSLSKIWLTARALRELDRRNENLPQPKTKPAAGFVKPRAAKLAALAKLGTKELAQFATAGGPDLSDLKGYPEPTNITHSMASPLLSLNHDQASLVSSSTRQTRLTKKEKQKSAASKSRRTSAYDGNFTQYCIQNYIYPPDYEFPNGALSPKPNNFEEIRKILKIRRRSLSPSVVPETAHDDFRRNITNSTESDLMSDVIPLIAGDTRIRKTQNLAFTNLTSITRNTTAIPKPDFFDGAHPETVNRKVRKDLDDIIIPSKRAGFPIAPNFFLEVKSDEGKLKVAQDQSIVNGAYGARAMHALKNYLVDGEPEYDGNAYAYTAILARALLELYAHHLTAPTKPGGQPGCHATLLGSYGLRDEDNYSTGRGAFRNLRMRAKEDRERFIETANARARRRRRVDEDTEDESTEDGSTEKGDNFSMVEEEQQDDGSSPLNFYDAHAFVEPGENTQGATQDTTQQETQETQLTNAELTLDYDTENTEVGVEASLASSFTSASREDYRRSRRLLKRKRSPTVSSSTGQKPRNPPPSSTSQNQHGSPPSSNTRKRTRSSPRPSLTRQHKRRAGPAG
ncbi:hypothetical protein M441DRAFT_158915 [Trichoderma asperellum CBS 433.97]|uniref:DUF7924 domain-containing protein n=1 Tax=Trichoderma asperellum (strain ATCC 204424 / CBS 433.97 / NBRC 101777) TaxID=1042311 RepID=A0A2T3ZKE8_TRIA4|nr:hypothetical protein M441DRAFT_158915 [Trichoderma asperellum CBS 433.97]PTB45276.1 hypothetical protein M441DRAFT_158915 [Trichoderma asperellum CBS 433.97]